MKFTFASFWTFLFIYLFAIPAKADQHHCLTKNQAERVLQNINTHGEIVLWCVPCDTDPRKKVQVDTAYLKDDCFGRHNVWIEGQYVTGAEKGERYAGNVTVAYTYGRKGDYAVNLGILAGVSSCFSCDGNFHWETLKPAKTPRKKATETDKQFMDVLWSKLEATLEAQRGRFCLNDNDERFEVDSVEAKFDRLARTLSIEYFSAGSPAEFATEYTLYLEDIITLRGAGDMIAFEGLVWRSCSRNGKVVKANWSRRNAFSVGSGVHKNLNRWLNELSAFASLDFDLPEYKTETQKRIPVTVSSTSELLRAIQNNAQITLKEGTYDLAEWANLSHTNLIVDKDTYGRGGLVLQNLSNLELVADGNVVLRQSSGEHTLHLMHCDEIRFEGIKFENSGSGESSVLFIEHGQHFEFDNCVLEGGFTGIEFYDVAHLTVVHSRITNGDIVLEGRLSEHVNLIDCEFSNSGGFDLMEFKGVEAMEFKACQFNDNKNSADWYFILKVDNECDPIAFVACEFTNNAYANFSTEPDLLKVNRCRFKDNGFADPE